MVKEISNWQILVWQELLDYQWKLIHMKLLLSGIEPQKSYLGKNNIQPQLIYGQLDVFMLKWHRGEPSLQETQKSTKSLKYSKFKEHQTRITGQLLSSFLTSSLLSLSGKVSLYHNTHKTLMSMVLISLLAWLLWNPTRESHAEWLCNTHTLMISTRTKS